MLVLIIWFICQFLTIGYLMAVLLICKRETEDALFPRIGLWLCYLWYAIFPLSMLLVIFGINADIPNLFYAIYYLNCAGLGILPVCAWCVFKSIKAKFGPLVDESESTANNLSE